MRFAAVRQTWVTSKAFLELRRNERLSRTQLEARKLQKFRRLVAHAARHSPYYAQLIRALGIAVEHCTPQEFPLLTKAVLMADFDQIVTDRRVSKQALDRFLVQSTDPNERFLGEYQVIHTSGSSGEVGYFVYSLDDWAHAMAQVLRTSTSSRFFRRTRVAEFFATDGHFAGVSMAKHWIRGHGKYFVDLLLLEINSPLSDVIDQLNAQQPHVLGGYNTALKLLAAKQREGVLHVAPESIVTGGEPASAADLAEFKAAFGGEVFNNYGSSEHLLMGVLGPHESAMTLFDDDLIYEPHDDHTIVTNLFNFTLPLIRYRMSDVIRPIQDASSNSPYLKIEGLVGRSETVPMFANEDGTMDFISPHTIGEIFVPGVQRFQMHLLGPALFRFAVCLDSMLTPARRAESISGVEQRLRAILEQKRMRNVTPQIEVVDDLPLDPKSRKFQLVVDNTDRT